jgi:hypothetical protein
VPTFEDPSIVVPTVIKSAEQGLDGREEVPLVVPPDIVAVREDAPIHEWRIIVTDDEVEEGDGFVAVVPPGLVVALKTDGRDAHPPDHKPVRIPAGRVNKEDGRETTVQGEQQVRVGDVRTKWVGASEVQNRMKIEIRTIVLLDARSTPADECSPMRSGVPPGRSAGLTCEIKNSIEAVAV